MSKSLTDTLNFWDKVKYRQASTFKFYLHNITRSSFAEEAQASMKAADEINVSQIDAVYYDMTVHRVFVQNGKIKKMERGAQGTALHLLNYPKDHHVDK